MNEQQQKRNPGVSIRFDAKWSYPIEYLEQHTPSRNDGYDTKTETFSRKAAIQFIISKAKELFPEGSRAFDSAMTAVVLFQRFFARRSLLHYDKFMMASACLLLGGKIEDELVQTEKVAKVYLRYARPDNVTYEEKDEKTNELVVETKDKINQLERQLLNVCEFDLDIQHPWQFYKNLLACSEEEKKKYEVVKKKAQLFARDALKEFTVCLRHDPLSIAKASIAHAGATAGVPPPRVEVQQDLDKKSYLWLLGKEWCKYVDYEMDDLAEIRSRIYKPSGRAAPTHASASSTTKVETSTTQNSHSTDQTTEHNQGAASTVSSTVCASHSEAAAVSQEHSHVTNTSTAEVTSTVESSTTSTGVVTTDAPEHNTADAETSAETQKNAESSPSLKRQKTDDG